jgi:hypothetical protein
MKGSTITAAKLGGAKRKNGHKHHCSCHICENMRNKAKTGGYMKEAEKEAEKMKGGPKKPNGHSMDCGCPICKNMMNKKNNGSKKMKKKKGSSSGSKKSNGHRMDCGCPICKNMSKHSKKCGKEPDIENQEGDIEEAGIKAAVSKETVSSDDNGNVVGKRVEVKASYDDYDILDEAEKEQVGANLVGGKKSRRRRTHRKHRKSSSRKSRKHRRR